MERSPIPAGAFVELNADLIDEGKFRHDLDAAIRDAFAGLMKYEGDTGKVSGTCSVTAVITIGRTPNSNEFFGVTYQVAKKTPTAKSTSMVKARAGKLLVQPVGSSMYDPEQMTLFDAQGRPIDINKDVAGKIEPATANA